MTDTDADWRKRLRWEFRAAKRLFVLGVGNPGRADDGAGSLCVRLLQRKIADTQARTSSCHGERRTLEEIEVLDGGGVPESATGLIRKFRPTHVLIVDAAAGGQDRGTIFFINKKKIPDDDPTTHRIPLAHLVRYLEESVGCRVILLGIEPRCMSQGKPMSPAVRKSAEILADALEEAYLRKPGHPARRRPRPEAL